MHTRVLPIGRDAQLDEAIAEAVTVLRSGGLVAFPTETVYGLGARAYDARAVRGIFEAKGRPANVPLIVHVRDLAQARSYARSLTRSAETLAKEFWPGPLSVVVERGAGVPDEVTAGGATVAMRAPAHPVALRLIEALGEGIAAPSANRHNQLPPVCGEHVLAELDGRIDLVLDAGMCPGGLESTVVDVTREPARVLRRGAVSVERIREMIDVKDVSRPGAAVAEQRHGWLVVVEGHELLLRAHQEAAERRVGVVLRCREMSDTASLHVRRLPEDLAGYSASMYAVLHELRSKDCDRVLVEAPPREQQWDAIWDRLRRLSG